MNLAERLPSYEEATSRDAWKIITTNLRPRELKAVSLACKSIAEHTAEILWREPALYFGEDEEKIIRSFSKFLRAALSARLSTRRRTHTLDLTGTKPSMLGGTVLPMDWLAIVIDGLPGLQSLIIHDLSAFDYRSLKAFNNFLTPTTSTAHRLTSGLRLLTASSLANAVSENLAIALNSFPALMYLDLSSTRAVNLLSFLEQIASVERFPSLEILKMRNIGLTNGGLWKLATGLGTRVWSLDIRRNYLTDAAVPILLEYCFLPDDHIFPEGYHDEQMHYMSGLGPRDDELSVVRRLARCTSLRRERAGITHLYISDNDLTFDSARLLVKSWRLTALDLGKIKLGDWAKLSTPEIYQDAAAADSFRHLLQTQMSDGARLRYLRIDHRFVTGDSNLLDMGILAAKDGWRFWPSGNWNCKSRGVLAYDKDFPGLGLHTLVLTGLPNTSDKGWITKTLLAFLGKCSEMEKNIRDDSRIMDEEGHPSSILRSLYLEMPETFGHDQLDTNVAAVTYLNAVDSDFSFFNDEPSRCAPSTSAGVAAPIEGDMYSGEVLHRLLLLRATKPLSWTGTIGVIRPLGPEERDLLVPSRYTLI